MFYRVTRRSSVANQLDSAAKDTPVRFTTTPRIAVDRQHSTSTGEKSRTSKLSLCKQVLPANHTSCHMKTKLWLLEKSRVTDKHWKGKLQVDTVPSCQNNRRVAGSGYLRSRRWLSILSHTNWTTVSSGDLQVYQVQWHAGGTKNKKNKKCTLLFSMDTVHELFSAHSLTTIQSFMRQETHTSAVPKQAQKSSAAHLQTDVSQFLFRCRLPYFVFHLQSAFQRSRIVLSHRSTMALLVTLPCWKIEFRSTNQGATQQRILFHPATRRLQVTSVPQWSEAMR